MLYEELLKKIAVEFSEQKIPYMIIGGMAVGVHGEERFTRDIDITLGCDINELDKILSSLKKLNLVSKVENVKDFVSKSLSLPTTEINTNQDVDFIFSFIDFELDAIRDGEKIIIEGVSVNFISKENLVVLKLFAGRPQDLADARSVILKNEDLKIDEIKKKLEYVQSFEQQNLIGEFEKILNDIKK